MSPGCAPYAFSIVLFPLVLCVCMCVCVCNPDKCLEVSVFVDDEEEEDTFLRRHTTFISSSVCIFSRCLVDNRRDLYREKKADESNVSSDTVDTIYLKLESFIQMDERRSMNKQVDVCLCR